MKIYIRLTLSKYILTYTYTHTYTTNPNEIFLLLYSSKNCFMANIFSNKYKQSFLDFQSSSRSNENRIVLYLCCCCWCSIKTRWYMYNTKSIESIVMLFAMNYIFGCMYSYFINIYMQIFLYHEFLYLDKFFFVLFSFIEFLLRLIFPKCSIVQYGSYKYMYLFIF